MDISHRHCKNPAADFFPNAQTFLHEPGGKMAQKFFHLWSSFWQSQHQNWLLSWLQEQHVPLNRQFLLDVPTLATQSDDLSYLVEAQTYIVRCSVHHELKAKSYGKEIEIKSDLAVENVCFGKLWRYSDIQIWWMFLWPEMHCKKRLWAVWFAA